MEKSIEFTCTTRKFHNRHHTSGHHLKSAIYLPGKSCNTKTFSRDLQRSKSTSLRSFGVHGPVFVWFWYEWYESINSGVKLVFRYRFLKHNVFNLFQEAKTELISEPDFKLNVSLPDRLESFLMISNQALQTRVALCWRLLKSRYPKILTWISRGNSRIIF